MQTLDPKTAQAGIDNVAKTLVSTNIDWIEESILVCATRHRPFWEEFCKNVVNTAPNKKTGKTKDFGNLIRNYFFDVVNEFHSSQETLNLEKIVCLNLLATSANKHGYSNDLVPEALLLADQMYAPDLDALLPFAKAAFPAWLDRRRTEALSRHVITNNLVSAEDVLKAAQDIIDVRSKHDNTKTLSVKEMIKPENKKVIKGFYLPSLGEINDPINGGLIPGELGLVVTPPNGGKTVLANQIAADLALCEVPVVLITTEQSAEKMYVRQFSAVCNIPYSKLAKGFDMDALTPQEQAAVTRYAEKVSDYLVIEDWTSKPGSLNTGMQAMYNSLAAVNKKPSVIIVDWLGGGMDSVESDRKRDFMIDTVKTLDRFGKANNVAFVVFAQANADQVKGVKFVGPSHVDGCKMLHIYATWGMGISVLEETSENKTKNTSTGVFARTQFLNFFKTRDQPAKAIKVIREFEYMRFKPESNDVFKRNAFKF